MNISLSKLNQPSQIALLCLGLLLSIMTIDKLVGTTTYWLDDYTIYNSALEFNAAFNGLYEEIWSAETFTFIIFPAVLLLFRKKIHTNLFPWFALSIVMLIGTFVKFSDFYSGMAYGESLPSIISTIHMGAIYYPLYYDQFDPSLGNALHYLVHAQLSVIVTLALSFGLVYAVRYIRTLKQTKRPLV